jgi:type III secretion system FlhB-like substrate exporter
MKTKKQSQADLAIAFSIKQSAPAIQAMGAGFLHQKNDFTRHG